MFVKLTAINSAGAAQGEPFWVDRDQVVCMQRVSANAEFTHHTRVTYGHTADGQPLVLKVSETPETIAPVVSQDGLFRS